MKVQCEKCGDRKWIYTRNGDRYGGHHGAICARCHRPVTLKNCLFEPYSSSCAAQTVSAETAELKSTTSCYPLLAAPSYDHDR